MNSDLWWWQTELSMEDDPWPPTPPSANVGLVNQGRWTDDDTAIGQGGRAFPATSRSAVIGSASDDPIAKARAFNRLVKSYWKPVYKHIRLRWRKSNEEAKDLTQGFFAKAFEKDMFATFDPGIARFRTYVRRCLDNYLSNAEARDNAQKRGGGLAPLSLDFGDAEKEIAEGTIETGEQPVIESAQNPEDIFDREWARQLIGTATRALEDELTARGRRVPFEVFARYDLSTKSDERPTYSALATELGIKSSDVSNYLNASRKRFREIVLDTLRELTASEDEFRDEARELLGIETTLDGAPAEGPESSEGSS